MWHANKWYIKKSNIPPWDQTACISPLWKHTNTKQTCNNYKRSTLCLKNDTDVAHYNFDEDQPILIIIGRDVAERVCYQMVILCEGSLGSRNSVRPSVTCVHCDKTKWRTADIFIPHERAITLLLWYQEWLVGDAPFPLKSAFKVTHPLRKTLTSTDFRS